jgi:hypothetical protein
MPEFLDDLHRTIATSTFVAAFMLNLLRRIVPPPLPAFRDMRSTSLQRGSPVLIVAVSVLRAAW